jgi:hypothetical protein
MIRANYLFFLSKIIELADTVSAYIFSTSCSQSIIDILLASCRSFSFWERRTAKWLSFTCTTTQEWFSTGIWQRNTHQLVKVRITYSSCNPVFSLFSLKFFLQVSLSECSTHLSTLWCTPIMDWLDWVHTCKNTCGGKNTWRNCNW